MPTHLNVADAISRGCFSSALALQAEKLQAQTPVVSAWETLLGFLEGRTPARRLLEPRLLVVLTFGSFFPAFSGLQVKSAISCWPLSCTCSDHVFTHNITQLNIATPPSSAQPFGNVSEANLLVLLSLMDGRSSWAQLSDRWSQKPRFRV